MKKAVSSLCVIALLMTGCYRVDDTIEPRIASPRDPRESFLVFKAEAESPFEPITYEEKQTPFGQELFIGYALASQFDLYRALTAFKRAKILSEGKRCLEIDYAIALSYYLGKKYAESVQVVEQSSLAYVDRSFPLYQDLLKLLYEAYTQLHMEAKAQHVLRLIQATEPQDAEKLELWQDVKSGNLNALEKKSEEKPYLQALLTKYQTDKKSISKAQWLNIVPGAGYWYLGMKQTAITAFSVNALFAAASYHFLSKGNLGAGLFTLSLESGWYLGGIYGAGLSAKRYNETLFEKCAFKISEKERYFPLFMMKYQF